MVPFTLVREGHFRDLAVTGGFLVAATNHGVWVDRGQGSSGAQSSEVPLGPGVDWVGRLCVVGDRILASVGSYPERQRQSDDASPAGGFVGGPEASGLVVVSARESRVVDHLEIRDHAAGIGLPASELPKNLTPWIQSCATTPTGVLAGSPGTLLRIDPVDLTASLLEFDGDGVELNRTLVAEIGDSLWIGRTDGGLGCISRERRGDSSLHCLLGLNNEILHPDAILEYEGRILTSSLAGIVEIDVVARTYRHYMLSKERPEMPVYRLTEIDGALWGVREDGFVRFDLKARRAIHYALTGDGVSQDTYGIARFEGQWIVATDGGLVQIDPERLAPR